MNRNRGTLVGNLGLPIGLFSFVERTDIVLIVLLIKTLNFTGIAFLHALSKTRAIILQCCKRVKNKFRELVFALKRKLCKILISLPFYFPFHLSLFEYKTKYVRPISVQVGKTEPLKK